MKTLFVSDLDGTLLNSNDRISEYSTSVINSLIEKGMYFTYATARSLTSASIVSEGLITNIPVIVYNGTFIINAKSDEIISSTTFTRQERKYIINLLAKHKIFPIVYSFINGIEKVSWTHGKENYGINNYLNKRKGDIRLNPVSNIYHLYDGKVFYFTCIGEKEELMPIYQELKESEHYNCVFQQELYCKEYWCEIMPKNATKANAIKKLQKLLDCDRIISFGDAINDIPMFKISDECYAVKNATEELKSIATGIIESNENDGVAKCLEKFTLLE